MAAALRARQLSPLDLLERSLARAEAWQPATNAFSQLWAEEAVEDARLVEVAARALARAWHPAAARGSSPPVELPPAAGIPIAVKDLFDVAGHETTGCCEAYRGRIALRDAPLVRAIREAGLVMMGKTNQHELAAGGTNLVSACGRTGNPWDPRRMTGGSSGGSAAAVAAGVVPWALGSDTGGSIRIPASMCGVFGLKPTTGRLSLEGVLPLSPSLDCPGPLAGTVRDLRMLWGLLADEQPTLFDPDSTDGGVVGRPIRIGVPGGVFAERVHPEALAAVEAVVRDLESAGISEGEIPDEPRLDGGDPQGLRGVWHRICFPEFAAAHSGIDRGLVAPSVLRWMERGAEYDAEARAEAARRRGEIAEWFRFRLQEVDALVIPTTPYPAPPADQETVDLGPAGVVEIESVGPGWLTVAANLAGTPALNLPAAWSSEGLPIGVSLVGRWGEEDTILRLAARWEAATGYRPRHPPFPA